MVFAFVMGKLPVEVRGKVGGCGACRKRKASMEEIWGGRAAKAWNGVAMGMRG